MDLYVHFGFSPLPFIEKLTVNPSPGFLRGFSFVLAADFHIRKNTSDDYISSLTRLIAEQRADMLLLGGDYGEDVDSTERLFRHIDSLDFPYGKFACVGNNDKEAFNFDIGRFRDALGLLLLLNEYVSIPVKNGVLTLIGIDEKKHPLDLPHKSPPPVHKRPSYSILLTHYPQIPKLGIGANANLIVSGHTHGGQINIFGFNPYTFIPGYNVQGMKTAKGKTLITSPGIGVSKLPVRIGVKPKIYVISFD